MYGFLAKSNITPLNILGLLMRFLRKSMDESTVFNTHDCQEHSKSHSAIAKSPQESHKESKSHKQHHLNIHYHCLEGKRKLQIIDLSVRVLFRYY